MSIKNDTNKPCLVETRQGLSVLYENRFLYSKYNPAANIERLVDTLEFKNDTLILCFSPILGYGLNKLAENRNQTLAQMALSWVYSREGITSVIIGASKPEQITENLEMTNNIQFTEEELRAIDNIVL